MNVTLEKSCFELRSFGKVLDTKGYLTKEKGGYFEWEENYKLISITILPVVGKYYEYYTILQVNGRVIPKSETLEFK